MNSRWNEIVKRQTGLMNFTDQLNQAIGKTRIAVFGCGGNGAILDCLLRTGFQHFHITDYDQVEASNLNRLPFTPEYIGMKKVDAWKKYLQLINPDCEVYTHQRKVTRNDETWVKEIVQDVDLIALEMSGFEANLVVSRVAANLNRRMVVGPGTSNSWIVSTLLHDGTVTLESAGELGTEKLDLKEVDYEETAMKYAQMHAFPGREDRLFPETIDKVRSGEIPPRSCKVFISAVNAAQCWEIIKNTAALNNLPFENSSIIPFPKMLIFDPWRGSSYYYNLENKQIGIPDWMTNEITWRDLT